MLALAWAKSVASDVILGQDHRVGHMPLHGRYRENEPAIMGKQQLQSNKKSGNTLYNSGVAWGGGDNSGQFVGQEWERHGGFGMRDGTNLSSRNGCGREISSG